MVRLLIYVQGLPQEWKDLSSPLAIECVSRCEAYEMAWGVLRDAAFIEPSERKRLIPGHQILGMEVVEG